MYQEEVHKAITASSLIEEFKISYMYKAFITRHEQKKTLLIL